MDPNLLREQGLQLYAAGKLREAITAFEQARAEFQSRGDAANAVAVANDLGVAYFRVGRASEARAILEETLTHAHTLGDGMTEAKASGNLAQVLERSGTRAEAATYYRRAADLFQRAGARDFEADTLRALTQLELARGRWIDALAAYDRALAARGGSSMLRAFLQIPLKLLGVR
ncbi:MAG: tetratricopeptide repeat protein [Chloroflexi bacterium]|nr:tetratricopeptide repeat protein [Chloroflexota bacterium]